MGQQQRIALARRALAQAEVAVGLPRRLDDAQPVEQAQPAPLTRAAQPRPEPQAATGPGGEMLSLPAALRPLLPAAGLRRGSTVTVAGSTSLLLAMAAAAAGDEGWVALVGLPHLSAPAAVEAGMALDHVVAVPQPGGAVAEVLGALVEGFDVLVLGATAALRDQDRRRVQARLRSRGAVLLGTDWPGSDLVVDVVQQQATGLGQGWGAVTDRRLHLAVRGRGLGQERRLVLRLDAEGLQAEPARPAGADEAATLRPHLRAVS